MYMYNTQEHCIHVARTMHVEFVYGLPGTLLLWPIKGNQNSFYHSNNVHSSGNGKTCNQTNSSLAH